MDHSDGDMRDGMSDERMKDRNDKFSFNELG